MYKVVLVELYGLELLMKAMHTHKDTGMYVGICKLFHYFKSMEIRQKSPSHMELDSDMACEYVVLRALQHSVTAADRESVRLLAVFLYRLDNGFDFGLEAVEHDPALYDVLLQSLLMVRAHINTETPEEAVETHNTSAAIIQLVTRVLQGPATFDLLFQNPQFISVLVQVTADSYELGMLQTPVLFQGGHSLNAQVCQTMMMDGCGIMRGVCAPGPLHQLEQAGALPLLMTIVRDHSDANVRYDTLLAARNMFMANNGEKLSVLRAGGLEVIAQTILPMPLRDEDIAHLSIYLMYILAKYPVYATIMHELGIFDLLQQAPPCENKNNLMRILQGAAQTPVYVA